MVVVAVAVPVAYRSAALRANGVAAGWPSPCRWPIGRPRCANGTAVRVAVAAPVVLAVIPA
ncbi:hypothetical protein [Nocardia beijingensis]|uniref:hypothetical protein n=1 Tax=Nocardia beijingensis TaxID=95162 RepID=UPI000829A9AE|nr:hypothetical protein [Nocardia beijingensis]